MRDVVASLLDEVEAMTTRLRPVLSELDSTDAIQVPRQGSWTKALIDRLWGHVDHLPGVRALFEATAARPNEVVSFDQILQRSGLSKRQQRNEHARLSRVASELFREKRGPIQNRQGPVRETTGRAEMLYLIGGTVAGWWEEVAHV